MIVKKKKKKNSINISGLFFQGQIIHINNNCYNLVASKIPVFFTFASYLGLFGASDEQSITNQSWWKVCNKKYKEGN